VLVVWPRIGALAEQQHGVVTRQQLTDAGLRKTGLPRPEVNAHLFVGGRWLECDCLWRAKRLAVELDGRAVHATARAFERDRARDRAMHAGGWRVVRITWRQLEEEPERIAADLRKMLV
jgi:hypothetical protein